MHLYKEYLHHSSLAWPTLVLYITALKLLKGEVLLLRIPLGCNMVQKTIFQLTHAARYDSHYTYHSLRASATTRSFAAEQLIISRTGHLSVNEVSTHKHTR